MATYYATYTIPTHKRGDTFLGVNFILKDGAGKAIDLEGATVELTTSSPFEQTLTTENNGGLTLTSDSSGGEGILQIDEQIIDWVAGHYEYEIIFTFASGRKRTYIVGSWLIVD
jgi:hypothetical protein